MVFAYHIILSAYGFWLPNDPRGSWSDFIRAYELLRFGPATKVHTRESLAYVEHNRRLREEAKKALKYPPVLFAGQQALAIARGFAFRVQRSTLVVYACAILPDHAHLVVARCRYDIEQAGNLLKGAATYQLRTDGNHPLRQFAGPDGVIPSPWAQDFWRVYIDNVAHLREAITYVENNPLRAGYKAQTWPFVQPFGD